MHLHWLYLKNDVMLKNKVILLLVVYLAPFVLFAQTSPYDMVSQMGRGINLGNVFSAPVEGNWAAAVEEQYFIDVAAAGFTNVRIPIDFFGLELQVILLGILALLELQEIILEHQQIMLLAQYTLIEFNRS